MKSVLPELPHVPLHCPSLGFCVAFCLTRTRSYRRVGGWRPGESKGRLRLSEGSTARLPAPRPQYKRQALKCSAVEMNYYMDRDQKKFLLHKTVSYFLVTFFLTHTHTQHHKAMETALLYTSVSAVLVVIGLYFKKLQSLPRTEVFNVSLWLVEH